MVVSTDTTLQVNRNNERKIGLKIVFCKDNNFETIF